MYNKKLKCFDGIERQAIVHTFPELDLNYFGADGRLNYMTSQPINGQVSEAINRPMSADGDDQKITGYSKGGKKLGASIASTDMTDAAAKKAQNDKTVKIMGTILLLGIAVMAFDVYLKRAT